jgi:hypothetical protein
MNTEMANDVHDRTRSILCHQNYQSTSSVTYTRVRFETMNLMFPYTASYKTAPYQEATTPYKTNGKFFGLFELGSNQNKDMQFQHQFQLSYIQN